MKPSKVKVMIVSAATLLTIGAIWSKLETENLSPVQQATLRLENQLSLPFSKLGTPVHFAQWETLIEYGQDLIWNTKNFDGTVQEAFQIPTEPELLPSGFPISNREFLCDEASTDDDYPISDPVIRDLICSTSLTNQLVADWELFKKSSQETILIAYFRDADILWVTKVKW